MLPSQIKNSVFGDKYDYWGVAEGRLKRNHRGL